MPYYSISVPERMPAMAGQSNGNIFDIIVDVENNRVEFRSTDQKSIIKIPAFPAARTGDAAKVPRRGSMRACHAGSGLFQEHQ